MPDDEGDLKPITDEQRKAVREFLVKLLTAHNPKLDPEVETLSYKFISPSANVTINFELDEGFLDWSIRTSHHLIVNVVQSAFDKMMVEAEIDKTVANKLMLTTETPNEVAGYLAYIAVQGIIPKIKSAFYELSQETQKIFEAIIIREIEVSGISEIKGIQMPDISEQVRELSKDFVGQRKKLLMAQINSFWGKPRLDWMPKVYPNVLELWQSVRKIYRQNSESETWREMVKAKYPDVEFDSDLLTRITGKLETLPEEIQAKLAETDGDHTPSSIALEHAARICGAKPYEFGTRHLYKIAKKVKTETKR
jgi:hypothetical protein